MRRSLVFAAALVASAPPARAAFERIPVGPETAASGEIAALAADPVFGSPATRGVASGRVEAWGGKPFGIAGLREMQTSAWFDVEGVGVGGGVRELGSPDYFERDVRLAISIAAPSRSAPSRLARSGSPGFVLGVAPRLLLVGGAFTMNTAFAADLGMRARLDSRTEVGLLFESLAGGVPGDPGRRLARTSFAVARELPASCRALVEVSRRADRAPRLAAGFAASPHPALVLRTGARTDPPSLAWGFTARAASFSVSFSSTSTDGLGRTNRVGLSWSPRIAQDAQQPADS